MKIRQLISKLEKYDEDLVVGMLIFGEDGINLLTVEGVYASKTEEDGDQIFVIMSPREEDNDE